MSKIITAKLFQGLYCIIFTLKSRSSMQQNSANFNILNALFVRQLCSSTALLPKTRQINITFTSTKLNQFHFTNFILQWRAQYYNNNHKFQQNNLRAKPKKYQIPENCTPLSLVILVTFSVYGNIIQGDIQIPVKITMIQEWKPLEIPLYPCVWALSIFYLWRLNWKPGSGKRGGRELRKTGIKPAHVPHPTYAACDAISLLTETSLFTIVFAGKTMA